MLLINLIVILYKIITIIIIMGLKSVSASDDVIGDPKIDYKIVLYKF